MTLKKLCLASAAFALAAFAHLGTAASATCPPPRSYSGYCAQVIVWAQDPVSGICCRYSTPCSAPAGWEIYYGPGCTSGGIEAF